DNREVIGQVVELTGPATLKLTYKTGGGSVRGTVEGGANAMVVLLADPGPGTRFGVSASCDSQGAFLLRDVPPGVYTIAAFRQVGGMILPELLSGMAAGGKSVRVEQAAEAQV